MKNKKITTIFYAVLAIVFYAINMPFSKLLLDYVPSTIMVGLLYLGAGAGVGILFLFQLKKMDRRTLLPKKRLSLHLRHGLLDILACARRHLWRRNIKASQGGART